MGYEGDGKYWTSTQKTQPSCPTVRLVAKPSVSRSLHLRPVIFALLLLDWLNAPHSICSKTNTGHKQKINCGPTFCSLSCYHSWCWIISWARQCAVRLRFKRDSSLQGADLIFTQSKRIRTGLHTQPYSHFHPHFRGEKRTLLTLSQLFLSHAVSFSLYHLLLCKNHY